MSLPDSRTRICYACKGTCGASEAVSASHNGLPVQLCPSCAEKAGITDDD